MDVVLHALADESRRTVLEMLRDHPVTAGQLAEAIPIARPGVSGICGCCGRPAWRALAEPARRPPYRDRSRKEGANVNIIGTMRALDETRGAVRVEDIYDTDIDDLWQACTTPARLARWIAEVSGDLLVGGTIHAVFTSTWTGPGRVQVCEAPRHLLLTMEPGTDDESQMEAWLSEEGTQTRLVVEERGLPVDKLSLHGAGWQAHLEDLGRSLAEGAEAHPQSWTEHSPAPAWRRRWDELTPAYEAMEIH